MPDDTDYDSELSDIPPAGESPVPRHLRRREMQHPQILMMMALVLVQEVTAMVMAMAIAIHPNPSNYKYHVHGWLSAAFTLSSCGTGLSFCKPDNDDTEMTRLKSIQSTLFPMGTITTIPGTAGATVTISASTKPSPPLPFFHCRGVTLLTSLITTLIYSDVNSRR